MEEEKTDSQGHGRGLQVQPPQTNEETSSKHNSTVAVIGKQGRRWGAGCHIRGLRAGQDLRRNLFQSLYTEPHPLLVPRGPELLGISGHLGTQGGCHRDVTQGGSGWAEEIPITPRATRWPLATSPLTFHTGLMVTPLGHVSSSTFSPEACHRYLFHLQYDGRRAGRNQGCRNGSVRTRHWAGRVTMTTAIV